MTMWLLYSTNPLTSLSLNFGRMVSLYPTMTTILEASLQVRFKVFCRFSLNSFLKVILHSLPILSNSQVLWGCSFESFKGFLFDKYVAWARDTCLFIVWKSLGFFSMYSCRIFDHLVVLLSLTMATFTLLILKGPNQIFFLNQNQQYEHQTYQIRSFLI